MQHVVEVAYGEMVLMYTFDIQLVSLLYVCHSLCELVAIVLCCTSILPLDSSCLQKYGTGTKLA